VWQRHDGNKEPSCPGKIRPSVLSRFIGGKRWFAERLRKIRRFRHDAPGRQQARMAGTPRAKRRLALLPGQNGRVDQLRTVMQEMSERFSVRHTASA